MTCIAVLAACTAAGPAIMSDVDAQKFGSQVTAVSDWSAVYREGMSDFYERFYGDPRVVPPARDEARALLCQTLDGKDTCSGPSPWIITFGHQEIWGYRVIVEQPDGQLALGPLVWEHGGPLRCPYRDSPTLEVVDGTIVVSIHWSGSEAFEVCRPEGCGRHDVDCECDDECHPRRQGICELIIDPRTLAVAETRGDCSGPPPA